MLFGAAYYPEYQSHDRSERDVALMGKAGFGYVRLRESTWHLREPADGDFLVDWIERVVDRCHAARLATVLGTPTYAVPAWLVRRYPEILAHSAIGRPVHLGARQNIDIGRGAYLFHAERMIRAAVGHFAAHPGVSGFQIDSETGVHLLHNPDTHQRFADWLRRRYGTVDAVNRAWGTNHWSLGLADWAGLWPADHNSSPGYDIDRRRFQTALTCQFLNWQHGIVREAARPDQFTTHCCVGGHAAIRPAGESRRTARIVDRPAVNVCYSTPASLSLPDPRCRASRQDPDPVPTWSAGDGVWTLYLQADFARVDERGFLVRESNASNAGHPHENQPSSPGQLRQAAYAMAARGARGIGYWHWHSYTGKEIYRRGIPGHDYEPGDRYEVAQLGAELRALGPLLDEPEPDSEVAVWLATGSDYALEFLPPQMSIVDEATPSGELDRHRVLIVPAAYAVSDEVAGRLVDYAARGGHLVLTFRSGYADEHARAREITAPGPFAAAAGIRYRDYGNVRGTIAVTSLRTDLDVSGGRATAWADYVEPVDAEVVLHYQAAHLRDYAAATTRVHGAGRVTWIGTLPDPELARRCAAVAGLWPPPPGLAPQVRADSASRTDGRTKALLPGELARPDRRGQCAVPGRPARGLRASSARGRKRTAPESRCTSRPERCSCSIAPAPFNRPGDPAGTRPTGTPRMRNLTLVSRRRRLRTALVATTAAAALSLSLAACSSSSSPSASSTPQKVTLTFWSWVPKISQAVDLWNSTHPNIQVKLDEVPGGSLGTYTKMYAAVKAGNAPDIGQVEYSYLPNFVQLGDVVNIGQDVAPATKADFPAGIWSETSNGSDVYAIPQDIAPMGFFYRKDIFAKDGITKPPGTWAQFRQDAQIIHKKNPNQYITSFPTNQGDWFAGLAQQAGGTWFGQDGASWKVSIGTDAATAKVASYWQGLISSGLVKAEANWSDGWDKDLQVGDVAGWLTGAWAGPSLQSAAPSTSGDWAIAPLPQWTAGSAVTGDWGGSTNVVLKGSKYPQQGAQFISWLNTNPQSLNLLATDSGLYLASTTWKADPSFRVTSAFFGGQPLYSGLAAQSFPPGWIWGPTMSDTFNTFNDATGSLGQGSSATISAALSTTQTGTLSTMKSQGFTVAGQ